MDIFLVVGVAFLLIVCFMAGWISREISAIRAMEQALDYTADQVKKKVLENLIHVIIEAENEMYYVYNMDDNTFMAQGKTQEELEENLYKRYPGNRFVASPSNLKEVGFQ
jgi:hypothetical protein